MSLPPKLLGVSMYFIFVDDCNGKVDGLTIFQITLWKAKYLFSPSPFLSGGVEAARGGGLR